MKNLIYIPVIAILFGCSGKQANNNEERVAVSEEESHIIIQKEGITLTEDNDFPLFADAELNLVSPLSNEFHLGENEFQFTTKQYQLGIPTVEENDKGCAYSEKGQHIHFILNNQPYQAKYENNFSVDMKEGKYTLLAFLSRSYHMSIKNPKAFVAYDLELKEDTSIMKPLEGEHLFYSRPKGEYTGSFVDKILLDFFLVNTTLSPAGNKVKVIIDKKTEFILDKWVPYYIEGLSDGKHSIRIQLIDAEGNLIPGPFNDSGERTFKIEREDLLKG